MRSTTNTTAAPLRAMLCFIDPQNTPKMAITDALAIPLAEKIKEALGDADGSESVSIHFSEDEQHLKREFSGVCAIMKSCFSTLEEFNR